MPSPSAAAKLLKYPGPRENLVVVEGSDDFYALGHLCDIHKIMPHFRLEEAGGYTTLRDSIDTYLLESQLKRIGFIVDADERIEDRWTSLRDVLHSDLCGYSTVPLKPIKGGVVIAEEKRPVVGLWVMPNNQDSGALEEFLRTLVPDTDPLWSYAEECVANLPVLPDSATNNWKSKARLHTWLAWRKDAPGIPIGQAMKGRDFDPFSEPAQELIAWLRRLFALETTSE